MCTINDNTNSANERREADLAKHRASQKRYRDTHKAKIVIDNKRYREANKEKISVLQKRWNEANKEKVLAYRKRKYATSRDQELIKSRQYHHEHKEQAAAKNKRWRTNNKEKLRHKAQRRRSREANLRTTLTADEWQKILDDHFHCCHYCGVQSDILHQEHKIPVINGGEYTAENIIPACPSCNLSKGTKDYKTFVKETNDRLQMKLF